MISHTEASRYFFLKEIDGCIRHNKLIENATRAVQNIASLFKKKYKNNKKNIEKRITTIKFRHSTRNIQPLA